MNTSAAIPEYRGNITPEFVAMAVDHYQRYKADMSDYRNKVRENDKWYKCNYATAVKPGTNEPGPATAFISNAIFSRYADFIDNYPAPNILERAPADSEAAKKLSDIIPVILELAEFKRKYKRNCYNKMKNGAGIYGIFCDEETSEIQITVVDVMDFFCDIHAEDIQDSRFIFVRNAVDNEKLRSLYPRYSALFEGDCSIEGRAGTYTAVERTEITDCYYKKLDGSVHMMKLVNDSIVIDATEDIPGYENGMYEHKLYPFVVDTMYPDDDNLMGFSLIDITRNPQMYVDKLDAAILKNAMLSSHPRFLVKDSGGINRKELTDMSNEVISSATDVDEKNIRMLQINSLPSFVREHREKKIDELKEIAGNRDWNNGGTSNGVVAASAIEALQTSGQKLSRANIDDTYDSYKQIVYMVVELVRQFFRREKTYRITDESGRKQFISFSGKEMYSHDTDIFGFPDGELRRAEYDIQVVAQKENPYTRETNNQTINALWAQGYFLPDNMPISVFVLKAMNFDGRDRLIESMQEYMDKQERMKSAAEAQQEQESAAGAQPAQGVGGAELLEESDLIPLPTSAPEADSEIIPIAQL